MAQCCSIEGCQAKHYGRGLCKPHYRKLPDQQARDREYEQTKRTTEARLEQERQRNRRRRVYQQAWASAHKDWGAWWEWQRRLEDRQDLRDRAQRLKCRAKLTCKVSNQPQARRFIGCRCQTCAAMWVSFEAMPDTDLCSSCNKERWGGNHRQRARRYGVHYQHVRAQAIFERDGWRCQICRRPTKGNWPEPRSATLDHIVPLFHGGPHSPENLQTACLACNSRKGAKVANDQLRLTI